MFDRLRREPRGKQGVEAGDRGICRALERGPARAPFEPAAQRRSAGDGTQRRATDRAGLLYRLTAALATEGLDVTSARIETLGGDAVDSFYVCNPTGTPVDEAQRRRVETALVEATQGAVTVDTPG